jgi:hypothetical protein
MTDMTKITVQAWLLDYAWAEKTTADKIAVVDCIMSQDKWKFIDVVADQFAGAQWEPGPKAFSEGQEFALSALYECHDGPHQKTCRYYKDK